MTDQDVRLQSRKLGVGPDSSSGMPHNSTGQSGGTTSLTLCPTSSDSKGRCHAWALGSGWESNPKATPSIPITHRPGSCLSGIMLLISSEPWRGHEINLCSKYTPKLAETKSKVTLYLPFEGGEDCPPSSLLRWSPLFSLTEDHEEEEPPSSERHEP